MRHNVAQRNVVKKMERSLRVIVVKVFVYFALQRYEKVSEIQRNELFFLFFLSAHCDVLLNNAS